MANQTIEAKKILATFNKSKSGNSLVKISGTTMFIVGGNIVDLIKRGEIASVEFEPGGDLMDRDDPTKVAYSTMQVTDFTETKLSKLRAANALVEEASKFDQKAYDEAMKNIEGLVL